MQFSFQRHTHTTCWIQSQTICKHKSYAPDTPLSWRRFVRDRWPVRAGSETGCRGVWRAADCGWTPHSPSGPLPRNLWDNHHAGWVGRIVCVITWQIHTLCGILLCDSYQRLLCVYSLDATSPDLPNCDVQTHVPNFLPSSVTYQDQYNHNLHSVPVNLNV